MGFEVKVLKLGVSRIPFSSGFSKPCISTRDLVLSILAEFPLISCSQVAFLSRRFSGRDLSLQAVHKALRALVFANIALKADCKYCLNSEWLESAGRFFENAKLKVAEETVSV